MATVVIFMFVLAGFSSSAVAAPFLVSDPYGPDSLQPTFFEVTVNGRTERIAPQVSPDGRAYLRYDLKDFADGDYVVKVRALNDLRKVESAEEEYRFRKKGENCSPVPKPKEKIAPSRIYKGHIR